MIDKFQRFTQTSALVLGQRNLIVIAHVLNPFAAPNLTADLDHFASPCNWCGIWDAVESFYNLGPGCSQPQHCASVGKIVDACRCHGEQARCSGINRQYARGDGDPFCFSSDITHGAWRVE